MALWTDVVEPAELTGYARQTLEDYEAQKGSLARWLPNRTVADIDSVPREPLIDQKHCSRLVRGRFAGLPEPSRVRLVARGVRED